MFKVPEKYRVKEGMMGSTSSLGNNGYFVIPISQGVIAHVIASDGEGWEHVSVHVVEEGEQFTPAWDEMCEVKDLFWDKEDTVIQYHPPESDYVNNHQHVLHMWRPIDQDFPTPPSLLVGIKAIGVMKTKPYNK